MSAIEPQVDRAFAIDVVQRLRASDYQALWAGGCVRDLLMGTTPSDYDIATSATPHQVRKLFGHRNTLAVGAAFGVIVVLPDRRDAQQIEVATFRTDAGYSDGRRPDAVTFSTPEEDAKRRDFTINGMFYDPLTENVIDYVDGQHDLSRKLVRAIGLADERIAEDKLRMLRAIRFAARFDFDLESETRDAIQRHADEIAVVSGERIAVEVQKTLSTDRAAWGVRMWASSGLMRSVLPEVASDWKNNGEAVAVLLNASVEQEIHDWRVRLAALFWACLEKSQFRDAIQSIRQRLKLSNEDAQSIELALFSQETLQVASSNRWSQVQPTLIHRCAPAAHQLLSLRRATGEVADQAVQWIEQRLAWPEEKLNPDPLLTGSDLIEFGLKPNPAFRELLQELRDRQLDGIIQDRPAALAWLRSVT